MEVLFLALALIVLFFFLRKPIREKLLGALDDRRDRIARELDEAQKLHEEAKALVAKYKRQLHEGEALATEIRERAEADRKAQEEHMRREFEAMLGRRARQAEERIAQEEAKAIAEVRARAADLAVRGTRDVLTERLKGPEVDRVMKASIEEVSRKLG